MKRTTLLLSILLISFAALFSQNRNRSFLGWRLVKDAPVYNKNEIKINLATTIFAFYPEISYERVLHEDLSIGVAAGVSVKENEYPLNFALTPYARWFFGGNTTSLQKYGAGFFIELNGAVFSEDHGYIDYGGGNYNSIKDPNIGAGLGLGVGWKYLSANNWIGEIIMGGGRDFINDSGYPRMGISIGKRF